MNATELKAEQAIAREGITNAEEVIEQPKDAPKKDDKADDKSTDTDKKDDSKSDDSKGSDDKPKYDKDGNKVTDEEVKETDDKKDDKKEDEFTADDGLEVEEVVAPQAPPTDAAGVQLSTAEQKFIVDNIGEPLIIRGIRGTGDDAKEVELKVFDPGQIPKDFQFASQGDLLSAQTAFYRLEQKAQTLLGNFRQQQSQTQSQDFEVRENEGIKQDIAELQKDGDFPKFKIQPGQKGFDDDPAAKQMAEVLDVMTKRNDQYLKEYQQGRPYKHIGFREAFDIHSKTADTKKKTDDQKVEDDERKEIANKVGTARGLSASKVVKPTVKSGMTTRDFLNRLDAEEF